MQANNWPVTFSLNISAFVSPHADVNEMISHADKLMYSAKNGSKNLIKHEMLGRKNRLSYK